MDAYSHATTHMVTTNILIYFRHSSLRFPRSSSVSFGSRLLSFMSLFSSLPFFLSGYVPLLLLHWSVVASVS